VRVAPAPRPRAFRRLLPALLRGQQVEAFLSPWQAFPDIPAPVAVWLHELPFVRLGPVEGRFARSRQRRWLARALRRTCALIVPATSVRDDLLRLAPTARECVRVVPHGFDPGPWREGPPVAPVEEALCLSGGGGRARARKKGLDLLYAAFAGPAWPRDLGLRLLGKPGLRPPPGVVVEAEVDDARLRARYRQSRLVVVPSRSEGFGFPVLEAMAAGTPVVAAAAGSLPEVAGDAAWLVPERDPAALAAGVARVHAEAAIRARLVAAGARRVEAFPPRAMAAGVLAALRSAEVSCRA